MASDTLNIVIGGEAGQGLVTVGQLLAKSLVRSGYSILVTQDYQSRIRGGHNSFAIRTAIQNVLAPGEAIDLLVALDADSVEIHGDQMPPDGVAVADAAFGVHVQRCLQVPFKQLSPARYSNVAALGIVGSLLGLDEGLVACLTGEAFGRAGAQVAEENRRALRAGYNWAGSQEVPLPKLPHVSAVPERLMMDGSDGIALGAVSAGLKFYSFYPMTPSTPIALNLAAWSDQMGLVVEQAEDEIAAINMAIGASFAGAPSMVGTSGGGFALMVEGVSLAGMTETPIVIAVGQRPAPATGLPTRTEQADLEFVLHAGHGEFPRAILAPGTVEECFHLTRHAFDLAQRFQGPVFILTDQFLADSYRAVEPFDLGDLQAVDPARQEALPPPPYRRHAITESGVSPRLLPGRSEHLVVTDSDEHTEDGHITEDLSTRRQMVEKRLRKLEGLRQEVIPPDYQGDSRADILLVSWGSTKGSALEAASKLRKRGERVATLHFSQVWPLVPEQFTKHLEGARRVACVEGNASGQFARLIRRETGFDISEHVHRYDGLPITPEYILRHLSLQGLKEDEAWQMHKKR